MKFLFCFWLLFSFPVPQKLLHPSADGSCPSHASCAHRTKVVYFSTVWPRDIGSEILSSDATHVIDRHLTWHRRIDSLMKKLRLHCRFCAHLAVVLSMQRSTVSPLIPICRHNHAPASTAIISLWLISGKYCSSDHVRNGDVRHGSPNAIAKPVPNNTTPKPQSAASVL